ncbi:MAG: phosphoglycerate dehydrogenase [Candidatus Thermoplasmatota archaeon]|nr:phosphoglycerate dehydrogenase [Candidatus Thermoplasmatota archaeon]
MKVLVADEISKSGVELLKSQGYAVDVRTGLKEDDLVKIIKDYDVLLVRSATKATRKVIEAGRLKVIGRAGIGVDNIDVDAATERGVLVMNAPSGNVISTAELTIGLMFALARRISQADASTKKGEWKRKEMKGAQIQGKTLGIVGLGRVGAEVAKRAAALGMIVVAYDPLVSPEVGAKLHVRLLPLDRLLRDADIVSVHTPLTPQTKDLIGKEELAKMKKGAFLINCARGGVVNEDALYETLSENGIAGAALDVFTKEPPAGSKLLTLQNIVLTPHLGATTIEAQEEVGSEIAEQVIAYVRDSSIRNAVNLPAKLDPEIAPYMPLAEKLGTMACQLGMFSASKVEVSCRGELAHKDIRIIVACVVTGLLRPMSEEFNVNYINALATARTRGIEVVSSTSDESGRYKNLISVELKANGGTVAVVGTLMSDKGARIVEIDGNSVDIEPEGNFLLIGHSDKPGMIGKVGTVLGDNDVNIASMEVARKQVRGPAMMILTLDDDLPPAVLEKVRRIPDLNSAISIKL